jgi:hypothetical protein
VAVIRFCFCTQPLGLRRLPLKPVWSGRSLFESAANGVFWGKEWSFSEKETNVAPSFARSYQFLPCRVRYSCSV